MTKKIVVALGGNAILTDDPTAKGQEETLRKTAQILVRLIQAKQQVVLTHGNGPQVGNLLLQQNAADSPKNPAMPLDTCVAMTQGSIGFWLVQALENALRAQKIEKSVVGLLTQVLVDAEDPGFKNPTKPIGPFLSKEAAEKEMTRSNALFKEDAGRGYRKVVASPKPIDIVEIAAIQALSEQGTLVVTGGGGGIPVIQTSDGFQGIEAVIDKDFASEKLAEQIDADTFIMLTGVPNVAVHFNQPNQKNLTHVTVSELKAYIAQNQFAPGSMLPKIEAAIAFVQAKPNSRAVITSLDNLEAYLNEGAGTIISNDA